jgi:adenine-specific DNA-methyltransferase
MAKKSTAKTVETLTHSDDKRKNIPTAEFQSVLTLDEQNPFRIRYPRNTFTSRRSTSRKRCTRRY